VTAGNWNRNGHPAGNWQRSWQAAPDGVSPRHKSGQVSGHFGGKKSCFCGPPAKASDTLFAATASSRASDTFANLGQ
jgi:hypothetical protein